MSQRHACTAVELTQDLGALYSSGGGGGSCSHSGIIS